MTISDTATTTFDDPSTRLIYDVYVRNRCLNILCTSLTHTSATLNQSLCEQLVRVVGFDWLMTLISPCAHAGTVLMALRILNALLAHPTLMVKFRDGSQNGGWLNETDSIVQNRAGVLLGFSVSAHGGASAGPSIDINPELCSCPGFVALPHALASHADKADAYLATLSLMVGRPNKHQEHLDTFDLNTVWETVFALPPTDSVADAIAHTHVCCDAVLPLLAMLHTCLMTQLPPSLQSFEAQSAHWSRSYAQTVVQFVTFMYHNANDFTVYCTSATFLSACVRALLRGNEMRWEIMADSDSSSVSSQLRDDTTSLVENSAAIPTSPPSGQAPPADYLHPSRRALIELLKNILIDSFHSTVPVKGGEAPLDIVLNDLLETGVGGSSTRADQKALLTCILNSCTEHLLASDILLFGASLPLSSQSTQRSTLGNYSTLVANVFYFAARLTDCVWNG
jgi:hypothetical protein